MQLVKPFHVQSVMMAEAVGEAVFRLMMFTLPILVVVIPVFGLQRPADPARYGWTLLSFMLGLAVNSQINFLLGCLAFELKSIWGVLRAKGICIDFLSGVLIPFTFFPAWVQSSVAVPALPGHQLRAGDDLPGEGPRRQPGVRPASAGGVGRRALRRRAPRLDPRRPARDAAGRLR